MSETYLMQANARSTSLDLQRVEQENERLRARVKELEGREALWREYEQFLRTRRTPGYEGMTFAKITNYRKRLGIEREEDR